MSIDPDIRRAETLDARWYTDPAVQVDAVENIFRRSWHFIGHVDEVPTPGRMTPKLLGAGTVQEPVILVRGDDDRVRVLSNVCTHRGMVMIGQPSAARHIRCGYHGRRFELDGKLKAAPGFEDALDFPRRCDDLPEIESARLGPLVFASLDPEVPFETWLRPVRARMLFFGLDEMVADPSRSETYEFDAPWAAYCDNYLEGMHIPYVHPGLADALDVGAYRTLLFEQVSLQIGVAKRRAEAFDLPADHVDAAALVGGYYFFCFPNLMLNFYPWGLSLNVVEPVGMGRTQVRFLSFVADPEALGTGASGDLNQVELEDEAVVVRVGHGLNSRLYRRGRYAPRHEQGVHHFHRLLTARVPL